MKTDASVVVGIGEALWDMLPEGKKIGGAPANFAYHVSQFGFNTCVVSAIGADALGNELRDILSRLDLTASLPTVDYPTGTVQVSLSDNGIPNYDICRNVAWDHIPLTPDLITLARHTRVVCFGTLAQRSETSRHTICKFIQAVADNDHTLKIFDINLRQHYYTKEVITDSLRMCNVLKINDEEALTVGSLLGYSDTDIVDIITHIVNDYGLSIAILTCGAEGSYVMTDALTSYLDTPIVDVADTVGAGDSFTAAFTAALLNGLTIRQAHQLATDVAAYVCTQHGAMPTLPHALRSRKS